jgi:thioester reductase-like protein
VGTPVAGRNRTELEGVVGCLANVIVLRADLSRDPTLAELIALVRARALEAYGHQELPFDLVVEAVDPPREPGVNPLFQAMLVLQNAPRPFVEHPGLEADLVYHEPGTAKFDVCFMLFENAGRLDLDVEFSTELFDESSIDRLVRDYDAVLTQLVRRSAQRLSALGQSLLGPAPRAWSAEPSDEGAQPVPDPALRRQLIQRRLAQLSSAKRSLLASRVRGRDGAAPLGAARPGALLAGSGVDWERETRLAPGFGRGAEPFRWAEPKRVLLTGASGFLGGYVLRELLDQTSSEVFCLVRAATDADALARIRQNLARYRLDPGAAGERIHPVSGDLERPRFGLDAGRFAELARQLDAVYHVGAAVQLVAPYEVLRPANVAGTRSALALAATSRHKAFHHVSTLSVFDTGTLPDGGVLTETRPLPSAGSVVGGYGQSKCIAEEMVRLASRQGTPCSVFRTGVITGDSHSGAGKPDDLFHTIAEACLVLGCVPDIAAPVYWAPVDVVARALVRLSLDREALGGRFHLVGPDPFTLARLGAWSGSAGRPLERLSYERWRDTLEERLARASDPRLERLAGLTRLAPAPPAAAPSFRVDASYAEELLRRTEIRFPRADDEILETYFGATLERCAATEEANHGRS